MSDDSPQAFSKGIPPGLSEEEYREYLADPAAYWERRRGKEAIWYDPGGRVTHKLKDIASDGTHMTAHMYCGASYPLDQVRPYDARRDHWRNPCSKC